MTGTSVPVVPFALNNGTIVFGTGGNSYEQAVSSFAVTPSNSTSFVKGIAPGAIYGFTSSSTYAVAITAVQDVVTSTSLQNYLIENDGTTVPVLFTAAPGGTGAVTCAINVSVVPPVFGGDMDKNLEYSVTFAASGKPVYGTAA